MLDLKLFSNHPEIIEKALKRRGDKTSLKELLNLIQKRKEEISKREKLQAEQNKVTTEIAKLKKEKKDAKKQIEAMQKVSKEVKLAENEAAHIEETLNQKLFFIPNIPHESVPDGKDASSNKEIRKWGKISQFSFTPLSHVDLGTKLNILDFETAALITGARFTIFKGLGARLERAIINFCLDQNTKKGYQETLTPFMVNRTSMTGTGQLPKFEEDAFKLEGVDYFLVPTAEVPLTNMLRNKILNKEDLPLLLTGYTPCFRKEAGSYGKDTSGLIRQHQFEKVELVKFVEPENSYEELEKLTLDVEGLLQALELPYRVVCLCAGDLGFSAAKTYDVEVWIPSQKTYRETSSCSNFEDFQARRANIRYRKDATSKPQFVHTLNGSGLATSRIIPAILEGLQQQDGSIKIPRALVPYMGGVDTISV
ncbi:MAG: serine--tRNA ligase [Deltaproteobacteria bacterium]|nr:serine--tRNA ligase [Deltaproteobacteria bacterium]